MYTCVTSIINDLRSFGKSFSNVDLVNNILWPDFGNWMWQQFKKRRIWRHCLLINYFDLSLPLIWFLEKIKARRRNELVWKQQLKEIDDDQTWKMKSNPSRLKIIKQTELGERDDWKWESTSSQLFEHFIWSSSSKNH